MMDAPDQPPKKADRAARPGAGGVTLMDVAKLAVVWAITVVVASTAAKASRVFFMVTPVSGLGKGRGGNRKGRNGEAADEPGVSPVPGRWGTSRSL